MLTMSSVPMAFEGHRGVIQHNAIESWTLLEPRPQIVLTAIEPGTREAAEKYGVGHCPVARSPDGVPLISDAIRVTTELAEHNTLAIVNSDGIYIGLMEAVRAVTDQLNEFLMVGRRWNVDITERLAFRDGWRDRLRARAHTEGKQHPPHGTDYFIFPKGYLLDMPDFAAGRTVLDKWVVWRAHQDGVPVIDCEDVLLVHQNHNGHWKERRRDRDGARNKALYRECTPEGKLPDTPRSADFVLRDGELCS